MKNNLVSRWLTWIAMAVVFSIACWYLSQWQFARQQEVSNINRIIEQNYDSKPVALEELLLPKTLWNKELEYRQVRVTGHYLLENQFLIRNRPNEGNPGFLQLMAFETDGGAIIWVERGWLPTGSKADAPDHVPNTNRIHRQVVLLLRPAEPRLDRTAPKGQLPSIDLQVASQTLSNNNVFTQAYGRLVSESPQSAKGLMMPKPEINNGNHLSYALQWLLFASMAFGAVFWSINQDRRKRAGQAPKKVKFLTLDKDAEAEDQILG
jgi:cytochrome oxidase assembly protein ShyY1